MKGHTPAAFNVATEVDPLNSMTPALKYLIELTVFSTGFVEIEGDAPRILHEEA